MKFFARSFFFFPFAASLGFVSIGSAAIDPKSEKVNLSSALERAEKKNQELISQSFQIKSAELDLKRIGSEFAPKFEGSAGVGPMTEAIGNATSAVENKSKFGRSFIGRMELTIPLYTWGRQSDYEAAATSGIKVKQAEFSSKEQEVRYQVKEAYYGFQYANSMLDFIITGKEDLKTNLEKRKKKSGSETAEDYKLDIFLREVDAKEAQARKYYQLALEGFGLRVGEKPGSIVPAEEWLIPNIRLRAPLEEYIKIAQDNRSEFKQLHEGISAKKNLAKAEKKALLPVFGALVNYEVADTNVRTAQPGVFAYDPYNRETFAAGVGFRLELQGLLPLVKYEKYMAESYELEAKEQFAQEGILLEVKKCYWELEEAEANLEAAKKAQQTGKKWLTSTLLAFGTGLGRVEPLVEAYGAKGKTTKDYFEAVFKYQMAWANLSRGVGKEVDPSL